MAIKMELEGFAKVGLTIESDSKVTCYDALICLPGLGIAVPVYPQIDNLASEIGDVNFSFVFRQSNVLANALAKSVKTQKTLARKKDKDAFCIYYRAKWKTNDVAVNDV
ncbi:hypothetical protein Golob_026758 [Gossypium lobatum]|uniref:Uncharacterized protein n=1 Tax=Gossypium lobatum TaxID=34289 RepID=A0A7J8LW52_9ROSI|nr:hypothetical protein [Gossypium lobatum]